MSSLLFSPHTFQIHVLPDDHFGRPYFLDSKMRHQVEINTKFVATLIRIGASALPFFLSHSLFTIHSRRKEMQNKNKNNRKVTKLPTVKLIEIVVVN